MSVTPDRVRRVFRYPPHFQCREPHRLQDRRRPHLPKIALVLSKLVGAKANVPRVETDCRWTALFDCLVAHRLPPLTLNFTGVTCISIRICRHGCQTATQTPSAPAAASVETARRSKGHAA